MVRVGRRPLSARCGFATHFPTWVYLLKDRFVSIVPRFLMTFLRSPRVSDSGRRSCLVQFRAPTSKTRVATGRSGRRARQAPWRGSALGVLDQRLVLAHDPEGAQRERLQIRARLEEPGSVLFEQGSVPQS